MKDWHILLLYPLSALACGILAGYELGVKNIPEPLTYSQRRDIAIQFMCYESHWKGMKTFCGNLPPSDGKI